MFDSKKDADAYDKMLELGEQFTALLEQHIEGIDETKAESFGLLLAKNKELVLQACKGKPEALADILNADGNEQGDTSDNVTPLAAASAP